MSTTRSLDEVLDLWADSLGWSIGMLNDKNNYYGKVY